MTDLDSQPGILFDRASIIRFAPLNGWVTYGLYAPHGTLLYAGATGRPAGRLLEHLRAGKHPTAVIVRMETHRNSTAMARAERELHTAGADVGTAPRRHHTWKAQNR